MKKRFTPEERNRIHSIWKEHKSVTDVAKKLSVTWDTARRWLDALGYRKDPTNRQRKLNGRTERKPWRNPNVLRRLYVEREFTVKKTAKLTGCHPSTIARWLRKYGVSIRKVVIKGSDIYCAKLTEADVVEMRNRYAANRTLACREELAVEKGVAISTVNKVVFRQSWKHVD